MGHRVHQVCLEWAFICHGDPRSGFYLLFQSAATQASRSTRPTSPRRWAASVQQGRQLLTLPQTHPGCAATGAGPLQQMHRATAGIATQVSNSVVRTRVSRKLNTISHIPFGHVDSIQHRLTHTALDYYLHSER